MSQRQPSIPSTSRIFSVDVFRGFTILAMLLVNDLSTVAGTPWWARHMPSHIDGFTFVDVIFPCFLFLVGMSIPLALGKRLEQGESWPLLIRGILIRTLSLLVVGVLMVNMSQHSGPLLSRDSWSFLAFGAVILLWGQWSGVAMPWHRPLKIFGILILGILLLEYRAPIGTELEGGDPHLRWLIPQWWGILGLIGWAYLTVAIFWCFCPRDPAAMAGLLGLLTCLGLAKRGADGFFTSTPILSQVNQWVEVGGMIGGHGSIVAAGCLLGMALVKDSDSKEVVRLALGWGVGLIIAGFCLRPYTNGFSKDFATPAWCLVCAGISSGLFALVHGVLSPLRNPGPILRCIATLGQWALLPYLIVPMMIALIGLLGFEQLYNAVPWPWGIGRALAVTLGGSLISLAMIRLGLRLRL